MYQEEKKEMIAALICDEKLKPMKFRELAGFLGIPKQERGELSEILDALLKEDRIAIDSEGRYVNDRALHVTGEFFASGRGFGFVRPEGRGPDADIYIAEERTLEAMHGDTVQVTVLKQADPDPDRHMRAEGEIVKIITRANETVVGTFFRDGSIAFVRPDNRKLDFDIFVSKEHTKGAQEGQKVVCRIRHFGTKKRNPDGIVTEILGSLDDPGIDVISVIRSYGIPTDFPPEVLTETAGVPQKADPAEVAKRLDLRELPTVTIDGEDAKDLDDAITIEEHDGTFTLGVHIADVSQYIKRGDNQSISSKELAKIYETWCDENAYPAMKGKTLIEYLVANQEKYGIVYTNNVINAAGRRVRGFTGIDAAIRLPSITADGWRCVHPVDDPFKNT